MATWHRQLTARLASNNFDLCFLWQHDRIYLMDNHRAALWCWFRHLDTSAKYRLFHIDAHYDCQRVHTVDVRAAATLRPLSLDQYLLHPRSISDPTPVVDWANYISLFVEVFPGVLEEAYFATHGIGDSPPNSLTHGHVSPRDVLESYEQFLVAEGDGEWIINIDLDYFFFRGAGGTLFGELYSCSFVDRLIALTAAALGTSRIACLTICLTPTLCGGWPPAEALCDRFCKGLGLGFQLP